MDVGARTSAGAADFADLLAAAFVTTLPMIIVFMLAQKHIVRGLSPVSGIK